MMSDLIDDRPEAQADRWMYVSLEHAPDTRALWEGHIRPNWQDMANGEVRVTIVSPEHPDNCPNGWYVEGWTIAPHRMDPPHKAGPFSFPMTADNTPGGQDDKG